MKVLALIFSLIFLGQFAQAEVKAGSLYDGLLGMEVNPETVLDSVQPGTVVIVSEYHGYAQHHENQRKVIQGLIARGHKVNVGMEFFAYTQTDLLDEYLSGKMPEGRFLSSVNWGSIDFAHYREQVLLPVANGGWTFALNAPRSLSGKIARTGTRSLTPEEKALLPPSFVVGNKHYFERFKKVMGGGHIDPDKLDNYFTAQSLWDDTAAWQIVQKMKADPDSVMVVIFGDFHNAYGGGLPDRLKQRGYNKIMTISQFDMAGLGEFDREAELLPHPIYGKRADYVWVSETPSEEQPASTGGNDDVQPMFFNAPKKDLEAITNFGAVLGIRGLN